MKTKITKAYRRKRLWRWLVVRRELRAFRSVMDRIQRRAEAEAQGFWTPRQLARGSVATKRWQAIGGEWWRKRWEDHKLLT